MVCCSEITNLIIQVTIALISILLIPDLQWFNVIASVEILLVFSEVAEMTFAFI